MSQLVEQRVPDLGDFHDVEVIEVLVKAGRPGQRRNAAHHARDRQGDDGCAGDRRRRRAGGQAPERRPRVEGLADRAPRRGRRRHGRIPSLQETVLIAEAPAAKAPAAASLPAGAADEPAADQSAQLLVIGAGPGGYTAAFRAADLGLAVTLVERWPQLGGVCLNVGCIPSKALLHAARVIEEAESMAEHGIRFREPKIDPAALRQWKNRVIGKLTGGPHDPREAAQGAPSYAAAARFVSPHRVEVVDPAARRS